MHAILSTKVLRLKTAIHAPDARLTTQNIAKDKKIIFFKKNLTTHFSYVIIRIIMRLSFFCLEKLDRINNVKEN